MKKAGILGGTFNPIHIGHLILAQSAYEQLGLDFVRIIPAGNPPHKQTELGTTKEQRLEMTRLAVEGDERFVIDTIELEKEEKSYTSETLEALRALHPDEDYYLIIGQDSLDTFGSWHQPERIASLAHIVAADRPGCDQEAIEKELEQSKAAFGGDFICIECPDIQISSTEIKERIRAGRSARYMVPEKVWDYISENGLYSE